MNIISCDKCGAVLDKEKLPFPNCAFTNGKIDELKARYHGDGEYRYLTYCPVCGASVLGDVVST